MFWSELFEMKSHLLLLVCCAVVGACDAPRGAAASSSSAKQAACPTTGVPAVHFYPSSFPVAEAAAGVNVPRKYTSYTVDAAEWKSFAQKVKERGPGEVTGLNIPLPAGCTAFSVSLSSAMSPELAAKYPDIISLKGTTENGADLRLDWNGTGMRGQVILRGDTWLLEPFAASEKTFYLIYHKADASATKKPFE